MNSKKVILASLISFYGISEAQQSQYFTQKEDYQFGLAENLYNTKVYNASQYEYSNQYFYNKSLSSSRKEASLFFSNVIGVILQQQYAEEGLNAFLAQMAEHAATPLASLSARWTALPQTLQPIAATTPQAAAPDGMVTIPGGEFLFAVQGIEIEG